jgi:type IX secretion system PorP/SprF family membrane protein
MMKWRQYSIGLALLIGPFANGQMNHLFFNEYLSENYYIIHPAMAGVNLTGLRVDFGTRQQWFSSSQKPSSQLATLQYKASANTTLGFVGVNDKNGYHSQYKYHLTYCYRIYLNDEIWNTRRSFPTKNDNIQELSFALNLGRTGMNLDQSSWNRPSQDPLLFQNVMNDRYTTFDAGIAYLSTKLSVQFSIHNLAFVSSNPKASEEDEIYNEGGNKIYISTLQYEIYTKNNWNFEPSVMYQFEEKTQETNWDLNFKAYKIIPNGRLWVGVSQRQNNIKVGNRGDVSSDQSYKHWTAILGLNYGKMKFGYQYTQALRKARFSRQGIHYINVGFQI